MQIPAWAINGEEDQEKVVKMLIERVNALARENARLRAMHYHEFIYRDFHLEAQAVRDAGVPKFNKERPEESGKGVRVGHGTTWALKATVEKHKDKIYRCLLSSSQPYRTVDEILKRMGGTRSTMLYAMRTMIEDGVVRTDLGGYSLAQKSLSRAS